MQEELSTTDIERLTTLFDSAPAFVPDIDAEGEGQIEARYHQWLSESDYYDDIPLY